jgi:hypothetical protein
MLKSMGGPSEGDAPISIATATLPRRHQRHRGGVEELQETSDFESSSASIASAHFRGEMYVRTVKATHPSNNGVSEVYKEHPLPVLFSIASAT